MADRRAPAPSLAAGEPLGGDGTPHRPRRSRRPRAVSFVAIVLAIQGVLLVFLGGLVLVSGGLEAATTFSDTDMFLAVLSVAQGWLVLIAAAGLWWVRPWGWLLAMTMQGLNLAYALADYLLGSPDYVIMVLGVILVLALNQAEVRHMFQVGNA